MKKILLFCLLSISFISLNAQYTTNKDTLIVSYDAVLEEFSAKVLFTNTSGASLSTIWSFTGFSMVPSAWYFGWCDNNLCYTISTIDNTNSFTLEKDSSFNLSVKINTYGVSGNILLPLTFNGGGLRKTIYIKADINATGINDNNGTSIKVFPNPSADYLVIENAQQEADGIILYNSLGKEVQVSKVENNTKVDLSNLSNGNYYAVLTKHDKKVFAKSITIAH